MKEKGFTLIELVVVIVILGILAATALPKFMDLRGDAASAAIQGVAGALNSAASVNYASRLMGTSSANYTNAVSVANCQALSSALGGAGLPAGYSIASLTVATNGTASCTLNATISGTSYTASFTAIGTT